MSNPVSAPGDPFNEAGEYILRADTRWVIVLAIAALVIFWLLVLIFKHRSLSREEAVRSALAFTQLYTAVALLALLSLTKPPAFHLIGDLARQTGGLIATIFLIAGVFQEISKTWRTTPTRPASEPAPAPAKIPAGPSGGEHA